MSVILRKLQEYPELTSDDGIDNVMYYVDSISRGVEPAYPPGLNIRQKRKFIHRYHQNFEIELPNRLFYRPPVVNQANPRVNLEVIRPANIGATLQNLYDDDRQGLGVGLNLFYSKVASQYLGINKRVCIDFLKSQGDYQLTRKPRKIVNKPLLAKCPNEKWEIDLMHLDQYGANLLDPNLNMVNPNNHNVINFNNT